MLKSKSRKSARRLITPEDLLRIVFVGSPRIRPDGTQIVFTRKVVGEKNQYETSLWLVSCDEKSDPRPFTSGKKDSKPEFSPDGGEIAFIRDLDKGKPGGPQLHLISAAGGEARQLTHLPEGAIGAFRFAPDGKSIAFSFRAQDPQWTSEAKKHREENDLTDPPRVLDDWWYRLDGDGYFNAQRFRLMIVDLETGASRELYRDDTLGSFSFDFAPDSQRIAITTNRDPNALIEPDRAEIVILNLKTGKCKPVPGLPAGPKECVRWSPDGKLLAFAGRAGEDGCYSTENLELWVCDPDKGNAKSLTADTDYCLMAVALTDTAEAEFGPNLRWSPDCKRIFLKLGWHGESHIASIPARGGEVTFHTKGAIDFDFGNNSADGKRIALTKATITSPPEVCVGELNGSAGAKIRALSAFNQPLLNELELADVTSHWVRASDGTKVQTWVMMPPASATGRKKKLPAVLEIHGGPHAQYGVGFFHEFQTLAAQGYLVFFSNPRGSKGYGRDHCAAIRGKWGSADWIDIQAVIDFMQHHPDVDMKRMGVMGGSYGGYMTNWIIGHTDAFAGAITDRCVSNVVTLMGTSDYVSKPDHYFPGNHWDRTEALWQQSPIKYLGNAKTPTLIIHSEGDLRCNVEQAEQVFTALKLLGVPTRLVRYPRTTSHGMSRNGPPDMRLHRLHQILEWWKKYLR